ncbi:hypothetical protein ACOSP7_009494 [Xanthoceras sorbifolium]
MHFSVRFLGSQHHFTVQNPKKYTLQSLICDVYLLQCNTLPAPRETFRTEIHVSWTARYEKICRMLVDMDLLPLATIPRVGSESPLSSYRRNPPNYTPPDNVVDISSDDDDPSEDTDDEDYDAFNPVHDEVRINEEEGMDVNDVDDAVEDEVDHDDPEDTQSEKDIMLDTASYDWDNDFVANGVVDSKSDEENVRPQNQKREVPFVSDPSGKIRLEVEHLFQNLHHFRQVIRDFVVHEGFQLRIIKNEKDRYTAEYTYEGCGWRIHTSLIDDRRTFRIKTMENQHSCQKVHKNQEVNAVWVARRFRDLIDANPEVKISFLRNEIHRIYGVSLLVWTLYRAKHKVLDKQEVINCKSYSMLHTYGSMVMEKNPGSMVKMKTITQVPDGPTKFKRFFLSFKAQKDAFLSSCRLLLGLDACHLKGKFSGVLMAVIGLDANKGVYPVAFAIAEGESKQSWGWFLELLYRHIGMDKTRRVTFISDRQKGVLDAVQLYWPRATHRYCVRHIIANIQAK